MRFLVNKMSSTVQNFSDHQMRIWSLLCFLDKFIDSEKDMDILDVGGTEITEKVLKAKFPNAEITILNLRKKQVKRNMVIADAQKMPFHQGSFDLVICLELIEHVYQPQLVIQEIRRISRENSLLMLSTPNMNAWYNRILVPMGSLPVNYTVVPFRQYGSLLPISPNFITGQDHCRVFNIRALCQFMKAEGFSLKATFGVNYHQLGHRFGNVRKALSFFLPKTFRENIVIIASNSL